MTNSLKVNLFVHLKKEILRNFVKKKRIDIELICLRAGSSSTNRKGSSTIYGLTLEYCRRYSSAKEFKEEK